MRRDRNTFFQESQMYNTNFMPNQMMPQNGNAPYQQGGFNSSYYYGPNISNPNNELENRLLKMERQISQLESRVSKLESNIPNVSTEIDSNNTVYMI